MAEIKYKIAFELDEQSIQNLSIQLNDKMRQAMSQASGLSGGGSLGGGALLSGMILDQSGRPMTSGLPPKSDGIFDRFKSTPAYQLLESQGNLRAASSGLGSATSGKSLEEFLADRILKTKGGGDSMISKALGELQEEAKKLSKEFAVAREEHERLMKSSGRTTEQEVEASNKLVNLKKAEADLAEKVNRATGMPGAPTGGGPLAALLGSLLGPGAAMAGIKLAQWGLGVPLGQMQAQGALGGIEARNLAAMGGTGIGDIMRGDPGFQGVARRQQRFGEAASVIGGAAVGAGAGLGIAGLLGLTLTGPVGIGLAGAGALAYGASKLITGEATKAGVGSFEAMMEAQVEAMGARGTQYGEYMRGARGMSGLRMGYGIGEKAIMRNFGAGSALGNFARGNMFSPEELQGVAGAGMGLGGTRGMGSGAVSTAAMSQGLLLSPQDFMRGTGAFLGAGGNDVGKSQNILTEVMTKAFSTGLNQSGMSEAMRAITAIASGGGAAAMSPLTAAGFINAGASAYSGADVGVGVGRSLAGAVSNMTKGASLGNTIGLAFTMQGSLGGKLATLPGYKRIQVMRLLQTGDPGDLEAARSALAEDGVNVTDEELQQAVRNKVAGNYAESTLFGDSSSMARIRGGGGMGRGINALATMSRFAGGYKEGAQLIGTPMDNWLGNMFGGGPSAFFQGQTRARASFLGQLESPMRGIEAAAGQNRYSMMQAGADVAPEMLAKLTEQREKLDRSVSPEMRGLDAFNAVGDASGRVATKMDFLDKALDGVLAKLRQYGYSDYVPKADPTMRATEGGAKTGQIGTNTNWWK